MIAATTMEASTARHTATTEVRVGLVPHDARSSMDEGGGEGASILIRLRTAMSRIRPSVSALASVLAINQNGATTKMNPSATALVVTQRTPFLTAVHFPTGFC